MLSPHHHQLGHSELSSVFGWVSIACWVVVYSPQIWENYVAQSGEGLSLAFIILWLIGDLTNLGGGLIAGLLPTMNILALYYTICDIILLAQVWYYRRERASALATLESSLQAGGGGGGGGEREPLLAGQEDGRGQVGKGEGEGEEKSWWRKSAVLLMALTLVMGTGVVAWQINEHSLPQTPPGSPGTEPSNTDVIEWKSQALGWISAVTYIASRVPQIVKNQSTRCEGLSLVMFFFSISGNVTYVTSILVKSTAERYLVANLPWLAGSGLTIFLDIIVLGQFFYYSRHRRTLSSETTRP